MTWAGGFSEYRRGTRFICQLLFGSLSVKAFSGLQFVLGKAFVLTVIATPSLCLTDLMVKQNSGISGNLQCIQIQSGSVDFISFSFNSFLRVKNLDLS